MGKRNNIWLNVDWFTVLLYLVLIFLGWFNIYAAVYDAEHQSIFDTTQRYGKQLLWMCAAIGIAGIILVIETNFFVFFSYVFYGLTVLLLFLVLFVGKEINGAKSWFQLGGVAIQPAEFAKFATSLGLARYMSSYGFSFSKMKSLSIMAAIILVPAGLILLQNDTGSALVYTSFVLVLFREGMSGIVLFIGTLLAVLFVLALVLSPWVLTWVLIGAGLVFYLVLTPRLKVFLRSALVFIVPAGVGWGLQRLSFPDADPSVYILYGAWLGALVVLMLSIKRKLRSYVVISVLFIGAVLFTKSVDYAFHNILEPHQQVRINELLGIESNPYGAGYHVNQSKIAIGSGGMWGKGFLKGTQTKFDFVPEQSTDFIFCTVGEEWGFFGTSTVIALFLLLFMRLIWLAERQRSIFSRIYGYAVAVILFFHFSVNIGMTIGLMPVIGIPLPFFSYGGSSLWSFTILLFIFIRLDASRLDNFRDSRNV